MLVTQKASEEGCAAQRAGAVQGAGQGGAAMGPSVHHTLELYIAHPSPLYPPPPLYKPHKSPKLIRSLRRL